jgi:hypothetical protein
MPPRRKLFKKMKGGGDNFMTGVDKNKISEFNPGSLGGVTFWLQADKKNLVYKTVEEYANSPNVLPSVKDTILKQFKDNLSQTVLAEIKSSLESKPNSLIPFELNTAGPVKFPSFKSDSEKLNVISLQDMINVSNPSDHKEKMRSSSELQLSLANMSIYSITTNVKISYNETLRLLVVSIIDPTAAAAELSEIIVFSRALTPEENEQMEGYLAYKKNDQYLLRLNHKYLPTIDSFLFLKEIAAQLSESEITLKADLENFDTSVQTYSSKLPTAEILQKAPPLKQKANSALAQISSIKQNLAKGALFARKQKMETVPATFDAIQTLALYSEPFTQDTLKNKLVDFRGVVTELEAYMKSLDDVDKDVVAAIRQNTMNEQIKKRADAVSAEMLKDERNTSQMKESYMSIRKKFEAMNAAGKSKYEMMNAAFIKKVTEDSDTFKYYSTSVQSKWDTMLVNFNELIRIVGTGEWLTYDPSLNKENNTVKRGEKPFRIEYKDPYLKSVQTLYESVRNQVTEGDILYLRNEVDEIMTFYNTFIKRAQNKEISPVSKKLFNGIFKKKLKAAIAYEKDFTRLYSIINPAINDLLRILRLNKEYKTSETKLEKAYPVPTVYMYKESSQTTKYVRKVNKHDHSLSMIEYVITKQDGIIQGTDTQVEFFFPSMELVSKNKEDKFFTKKIPFCDDTGLILIQKFMILEPYTKTENVLDSIPKTQLLPKYFHIVNGLFEIPRDAENSIYELSASSPQMPVLLPKYAMSDGAFFICVNVGEIPIIIRIPGTAEEFHDVIGPNEICMYIHANAGDMANVFYGRVQWDSRRIAYDTIMDVPRSSLCCKITDISKTVFMRSDKVPLFDRNGFLVEAVVDDNSCVYDIDDFYRACPYKVTKAEKDMKISELELNADWDEKPIPGNVLSTLRVVKEASSGLAVFCSEQGIPAVNEFGFTKYLRSPLLEVDKKIVTRVSRPENVEVTLTPTTSIVQYGLMPNEDIFLKSFRTSFVKIPQENTFIFVDSVGHPLVSPLNQYIQVEQFSFEPPYYLKYTDLLGLEYAFIPDVSDVDAKITFTLEIRPYPRILMQTADEQRARKITSEIQILSYRYATGAEYIQYTLTNLKTKMAYCNSLTERFSGIRDTIALIAKCISNISTFQTDYQSYRDSIIAMTTRNIMMDKSKDEAMEISTFDLKIKDSLTKVQKSYKTAYKPVEFFESIVRRIDSIREKIADLSGAKNNEIVESITHIQGIIQKQAVTQGGSKNADLAGLLKTCTVKKVDFDGIVKRLQSSLDKIPTELDDLEGWVNDNDVLIDNATAIHKEILDIDNLQVINVFTQQMMNDLSVANKQLQENKDKVKGLIEYKKRVALWLGLYPDAAKQLDYNTTLPMIPSVPLKGYALHFIPFEEMDNPSLSRDWYSLENTDILSTSLKSRISLNLVAPMKALLDPTFTEYYKKYDIDANVPEFNEYQKLMTTDLKKILDASNKTTNEHVATAIEMEAKLQPIFKEYESIRSDLRAEIQKVLTTLASEIQKEWLDSTGKRTAIQTNIAVLQPYLSESQITQTAEMSAKLDNLFLKDALSTMGDIQRSLNTSDYYANFSYIKMLEIHESWKLLLDTLKNIRAEISTLRTSMENVQNAVLDVLHEKVKVGRENIDSVYSRLKTSVTDGTKLKDITMTIDPQIQSLSEKTTTDIPACIVVLKQISEIESQLKKYSS